MENTLFPEMEHKPLGEIIAHWDDYLGFLNTIHCNDDDKSFVEDTIYYLKNIHHGEGEEGGLQGDDEDEV